MGSPELLDARVRVPDSVVSRAFESETLLLNLRGETYHGVDGAGPRVLELLLETAGDVRLSAQRLADEHALAVDDVADDVAAFVSALLDRGLLELAAS